MNPLSVALAIFLSTICGAALGRLLGSWLPVHHLSDDTKNIVSLGTGFIATMAALVIGLMVSAAKDTFDQRREDLDQACIQALIIDRNLSEYGTDAEAARETIVVMVKGWLDRFWAIRQTESTFDPMAGGKAPTELLQSQVRALQPADDGRKEIRDLALGHIDELIKYRWTLFEKYNDGGLPTFFVLVVTFWLALIFLSFGLFAPANLTADLVLLVCAFSAAAALLLIVEMEQPFVGWIQLSERPLEETLVHLDR